MTRQGTCNSVSSMQQCPVADLLCLAAPGAVPIHVLPLLRWHVPGSIPTGRHCVCVTVHVHVRACMHAWLHVCV